MSRAPISHHVDLYRYWDAKRGGAAMPARADLDPMEIPQLLPYITLIDRPGGQFRYRLVGTAASEDLGRDLTGSHVGSYVSPPEYAAAIEAIYERIFATGRPLFTTGEYRAPSMAVHALSRLIVPLGADRRTVDMAMFTRVARFHPSTKAGADWLIGAPGKVCDVVDVNSAAEAEALCLEWQRACEADRAMA